MEQFYEISIILMITLVISIVIRFLKQPLIIGYILTGLLVGPYFLNILKAVEVIELFSKLGITALLFVVGIGLNPKLVKELGTVSLVTGVGQVLFTSLFGYLLGVFLGFNPVQSVFISVALTFSSTIIILKLLTDVGDTGKLYGRIAIGFLLVQDLIATIILVVLSGLNTSGDISGIDVILDLSLLLLKGLLLLLFLFFISLKIFPRFTSFFSKSQEFLFIFSLAWGMGIAAVYYKVGRNRGFSCWCYLVYNALFS